jgi:hypothetical protein
VSLPGGGMARGRKKVKKEATAKRPAVAPQLIYEA